jgi:predicted phosphate transport protein (TIGR00153 family)
MEFLKKKKKLISDIDHFWDTISKAALVFKAGTFDFFDGQMERLHVRLKEIDKLESDADSLRREIKVKVYSQMLIPESRGDVLGLLETSDNVIDRAKKVLYSLEIEKPVIPNCLVADFKELSETAANGVDEMVKAARAFFADTKIINDFINKVYYYEHEADKLEEQIKRKAFATEEIDMLSRRVQLRYFAEKISLIADQAEGVCERLTIYTIKRSI